MPKIFKALFEGSIKAVAFHITLTYILPIGSPIMAAWLGYVQGLPLMYIFVGAILTFAGASTGLLRFEEWLFRRKVDGKLIFSRPNVFWNIAGDGMGLGVVVKNTAHFPIELKVSELRTEIAHTTPSKKAKEERRVIVPPGKEGWWDDHIINFPVPKSGNVKGFIEFKFEYGRVGFPLKYIMEGKKRVYLKFDEKGNVAAPPSWYDATLYDPSQ